MMRNFKYLMATATIALLCSCGTTTYNHAYSPAPKQLRAINDCLVYLGETEVEITYSSYFGIFRNIHTINNEEYDNTNKKITRLGRQKVGNLSGLSKAAYKVLEVFPEAQYYQVVRTTTTKERLFLGSEVKKKALIKAYKYK